MLRFKDVGATSNTRWNAAAQGSHGSWKVLKLGIGPEKVLIFDHSSAEESTRMWTNAQRDGRPAAYRWRPLYNAAKFG